MKLSKAFIDTRELGFIENVLLEQCHLGMGQEVKKFEEELQAYIKSPNLPVATNTGTSAIQLALQAMGIKPGDEVLAPSITYVASYQAISATGAKAVSCEVHAENGLLDLIDAENRITKATKVLMYVHYASHFSNREAVYHLAKKYNLRVLEDAAHSFGSAIDGVKIGAQGDTFCFSFDGIKNITCGEGGAIFSSDRNLLIKARDLRLLAVEKDTEKRFKGERSWEFDVVEQGWRYHMSNVMAAIGRCQLQKFEKEIVPKRLQLTTLYNEMLFSSKEVKPLLNDYGLMNAMIVPHIYPVLVQGESRDELRNYLNEFGIECGIHYYPNHLLSFYKTSYSLKNAEEFFRKVLTLPLHPGLSFDDVKEVCSRVNNFKNE